MTQLESAATVAKDEETRLRGEETKAKRLEHEATAAEAYAQRVLDAKRQQAASAKQRSSAAASAASTASGKRSKADCALKRFRESCSSFLSAQSKECERKRLRDEALRKVEADGAEERQAKKRKLEACLREMADEPTVAESARRRLAELEHEFAKHKSDLESTQADLDMATNKMQETSRVLADLYEARDSCEVPVAPALAPAQAPPFVEERVDAEVLAAQRMTADNLPFAPGEWQAEVSTPAQGHETEADETEPDEEELKQLAPAEEELKELAPAEEEELVRVLDEAEAAYKKQKVEGVDI